MSIIPLKRPMPPVDRTMPDPIPAEQAILGAILVNNEAYNVVSSFLKPSHFFEDLHRHLFEVASSMIKAGKLVTPTTMKAYVANQDLGVDEDGRPITPASYCAKLASAASTVINAEQYGRAVYDQAILRQTVELFETAIESACNLPPGSSPSALISGLEKNLAELSEVATIDDAPLIRSSAEFRAGFVPPDYHIYGLTQRRFCYSLTAPTGTGKTNILLNIAASTALGRSFAGREVERGRVLFLAGENPDDVRMRWIALAEHMGFDPDAIDVHFIPGTFKIGDMKRRIRRETERLGDFALVIVDTSAAYFPGDDENNNVEMGAHAREMREFTTLPGGPCVIIACHPAKDGNVLLPRGGGAFVAEVDGNLVCKIIAETVSLHWYGKFRGPDFEAIPFENVKVFPKELRDSKGRPISSVFAKLLTEEEQQQRGAGARSDEDLVLVVLSEHQEISVAGIADMLGWLTTSGKPHKSKVQRVLERLKAHKLVTIDRSGNVLTTKGKEAAKQAKETHDLRGVIHGL